MSIEAFLDETIRIKDVESFMNHVVVNRPPKLFWLRLQKLLGLNENIIRAKLNFYKAQVLFACRTFYFIFDATNKLDSV